MNEKDISKFNVWTTKPEDEYDVRRILGKGDWYYYLKEFNRWFRGTSVTKMMRKIGIDPQEWYDKYILMITDSSQRPKCQCGKERKFKNICVGYLQSCCSNGRECAAKSGGSTRSAQYKNDPSILQRRTETVRKKREAGLIKPRKNKLSKEVLSFIKSNATKNSYKNNPDRSKKQSETMKEKYKNPEYKSKMSKSIKEANSKLEVKEKHSKSSKKMWNKPGRRETHSKYMIEKNQNAEWKAWKEEKRLTAIRTPESRAKIRESSRKSWENPTERMLNPNYTNTNGHEKGLNYSGIRSKIYSVYEDKIISFDSNWERKWFINTSNNPDVVKIIRNPKPTIPYELDGVIHRYIPDFLIEYSNGYKELIEIKPHFKLSYPSTIAKAKAAELYAWLHGIGYKIITNKSYPF